MLQSSQLSESTGEVCQLSSAIFPLIGKVPIGQCPRITATVQQLLYKGHVPFLFHKKNAINGIIVL